jgi:hypothetical protein
VYGATTELSAPVIDAVAQVGRSGFGYPIMGNA